jgi:MOSC domain-containing protein YiiM
MTSIQREEAIHMHESALHLSTVELEQGLADVLASPRDTGRLEAIFVRPAANERRALAEARLSPDGGIDGDRWVHDSYYRTQDGRSDTCCQVSLMNAKFLRLIAGQEDAMCLAGDNLIVDLDLSDENLPAGSRLAIGPDVILEISEQAHTGCSQFAGRYGNDACGFANNKRGKAIHLRGRYARIVRGGNIRHGDTVRKQTVT